MNGEKKDIYKKFLFSLIIVHKTYSYKSKKTKEKIRNNYLGKFDKQQIYIANYFQYYFITRV